VSDDDATTRFVQEFALLSPDDQGLVMAVVYRLRRQGEPDDQAPYPRDVPFMDFDD
jgi:hypothetical protein